MVQRQVPKAVREAQSREMPNSEQPCELLLQVGHRKLLFHRETVNRSKVNGESKFVKAVYLAQVGAREPKRKGNWSVPCLWSRGATQNCSETHDARASS